MSDTDQLLAGIRVLDLSQYIPGPYATRQMVELGADVIKLEPPQGDPMRHFLCAWGDDLSVGYQALNRGKRIIRADLKSYPGKATLERLLQEADVLVESYRPGVLTRLGFSPERLREAFPRLIHCALSGYGQNGPYRLHAGHDLTYCAVGGMLSLTGSSDHPAWSYPPVADHAGAQQALTAVLAALFKRESDGRGRYLDIALSDSVANWQYLAQTEASATRETTLLNGGAACYNLYATADQRHIALAALEEKFWQRFCAAVERPDWIAHHQDPLPQTDLIAEVSKRFASQPISYWNARLLTVDCCYEPVPEVGELGRHPQLQARGLDTGNCTFPVWIDGSPVGTSSPLSEVAADAIAWRH